jgi:AcrR family transcriptional regulator
MPRVVDVAARREALLEGAFSVFAARGYGSVSMRDLARDLGVTTGSLYHYFSSKEALFEEMVRYRATLDVAEATRDLPPDAPPQVRLAAFTAFFVRRLDPLQDALRVVLDFHQQRGEPEARAFVGAVLDAYRDPLRGAFGDALAPVALSLLLGALVQRMLAPEHVDLRAHLDALARWRAE